MRISAQTFRPRTLFPALVLLLLAAAAVQAAELAPLDSVLFDAIWNGKKIGRMSYSVTEQPGPSGPLTRRSLYLNLAFRVLLIKKVSIEMHQITLHNPDGTFSFSRSAGGEGHLAVQTGYYDGEKLVCDTDADGKKKHQEFADSLFDCTSLDNPEVDMSPGEEKTVRELRIENLRVHDRTIHCLRYEDLCVGHDTVACKVFGNEGHMIWISRDSSGVLIKDQRKDKKAISFLPVAVYRGGRGAR